MKNPERTLDWHWREPSYPAARYGGPVAAAIAAGCTLYRCFHCKGQWLGVGRSGMRVHQANAHPDLTMAYTVYPPAIGVAPRGRDA